MILTGLWSLWLKKSKLYRYRTAFRVLFWLALLVSYISAVLPSDLAPHIEKVSDKAHHVFAFVVLGVLLRLGYRIPYWYGLAALVCFGTFIEISQYYTPDRCAEYQDIIADTIGIFIGFKLYKYLRKVI